MRGAHIYPPIESYAMKIALLVLSSLAFLAGFGILKGSQSAIHEIEGFVLYIVSAVLFSGAAIVSAINRVSEKLDESTRKPEQDSHSHTE